MPDYHFPEVNTDGQFIDPKVIADIQAKAKSSIDAVIPPSGTEGHALVKTSTGTKWGSVEPPYELRGTGFPEGKVTANPGTYYTDTAVTSGAWCWFKKSGTGNTGWVVQDGDTGWRNFRDLVVWDTSLWGVGLNTLFRRIGNTINLRLGPGGVVQNQSGKSHAMFTIGSAPVGWMPTDNVYFRFGRLGGEHHDVVLGSNGTLRMISGSYLSHSLSGEVSYTARNPAWPSTLPGSPA